jgi:hypothetical protein
MTGIAMASDDDTSGTGGGHVLPLSPERPLPGAELAERCDQPPAEGAS